MKSWLKGLAVVLIFVFPIGGVHPEQANANTAILVAAPGVAIGSLGVMAAAATAAASVGIISASQNKEFQRSVAEDIEKIKTAGAKAIEQTVMNTLLLYEKVTRQAQNRQCPEQKREANCIESIEHCCGDFLVKFSNQIERGRGGIILHKGKNKFNCCMEWDHLHGGLEIFDERGNHLGERGCDDLSEDPCEWTPSRGKHAEPGSSTHRPRSAACHP